MALIGSDKTGITLLLGGSRSGKSALAERLATESGEPIVYVASGKAIDDEMRERIEKHQKRRPRHWATIEVDGDMPRVIKEDCVGARTIIIDCLTVYVAELMTTHNLNEKEISEHFEKFLSGMPPARVIMVSNEVGMGLVPPYPSGRVYRDVLGRVNQIAAAAADTVLMMVAGIPVEIKGEDSRQ